MIKTFSIHWLPDVQVEYEFKKGSSAKVTPVSVEPPTAPTITGLKVTVTKGKKTVDLTDVLPSEVLDEIIDAINVDIVNGETIDRDEYDAAFMDADDG